MHSVQDQVSQQVHIMNLTGASLIFIAIRTYGVFRDDMICSLGKTNPDPSILFDGISSSLISNGIRWLLKVFQSQYCYLGSQPHR